MTAIRSFDDIIARVGGGYWRQQPIWGELTATSVTFGGNQSSYSRIGWSQLMPGSLPTGVTGFICTSVAFASSTAGINCIIAYLVNLGSLDISGPTFTDGSTMPTVTECGVSRKLASSIMCEVTTALNATPGTVTVTYKDQDDNTAEANTAQTLPASAPVGSAGLISLNAGDWGAVDITTATRGAGTTPTGVIKFWGLIPVTMFMSANVNPAIPVSEDLISVAPHLFNAGINYEIGVFGSNNAAAKALAGSVFFVGNS